MAKRLGEGTMLIPRPLDVDALVRRIPRGKIATVTQIREHLAAEFKVDVTCPLTTGIFLRIAAETAEEDRVAGAKKVTPYWRVIKFDGTLYEKFPGGIQAQARHLAEEGHVIEVSGKSGRNMRVVNFDRRLARF